MQNTVGLQKTLKETIEREREAAGREEHKKLQEELKRMADLIKENEMLKVKLCLTTETQ